MIDGPGIKRKMKVLASCRRGKVVDRVLIEQAFHLGNEYVV